MIKIILAVLMFTFFSCNNSNHDWYVIFDGKDVRGMRGYNMENFPWDSWEIDDNSLKTIPGTHGVDIISSDIFEDFELELEWKIQKGSNSGIFYFANEKGDYIWQSAPEMQVLDNLAHHDRLKKETSAGALYGLIAPVKDVVKPVGEYNKVKIKSKNKHIEHWLNGTKILDYNYDSFQLKNLIKESKFKDMPFFAKSQSGQIGFQGDHGEVWYRNIRIRKL